jgi:hypothetical protein
MKELKRSDPVANRPETEAVLEPGIEVPDDTIETLQSGAARREAEVSPDAPRRWRAR